MKHGSLSFWNLYYCDYKTRQVYPSFPRRRPFVHVGLFLCMIGSISLTPMLLWLCCYIYSQPVDDKRGKWLKSCFFKLDPEDALDFPSWTTYHLRGAVKTYYKCYPNREFYCIVDTLDRENSRDAAGERQSFLEIRRHCGIRTWIFTVHR